MSHNRREPRNWSSVISATRPTSIRIAGSTSLSGQSGHNRDTAGVRQASVKIYNVFAWHDPEVQGDKHARAA